jgi:sigma-B regulation protein RsbU (phosphoserine phosphatase)
MQGSVREIAVEFVRADGARLPALVNSVLRRDDAGEPAMVRTAVFPATDRREYERELLRARRAAEASEARARELARTLQESLIPPELPRIPGLQVAGRYRPAGDGAEVGGDFYDVFEIGPGDWGVAVGDVGGKGVHAAVTTGLARHTVRAAANRRRRPTSVLAVVNQALRRQGPDRFCSILHGRLRRDPVGRVRLTVASGGHPAAVAGLRLRPGGHGGPARHGARRGRPADAARHDRRAAPGRRGADVHRRGDRGPAGPGVLRRRPAGRTAGRAAARGRGHDRPADRRRGGRLPARAAPDDLALVVLRI